MGWLRSIFIYIFFFDFIDACGFVWLLIKSGKMNKNYEFDRLWVVVVVGFMEMVNGGL